LEDSAAEIGISETTNGEQINLTSQSIFEMMEESKESLRRVQVGLFELNEQVHIACSRSLTACMRPKQIQPLYFEFSTGRHCNLLDFFQRHPYILLFFPHAQSLSPLHLRQHRCCLREPEGHVHGAV